MTRAWQWLCGLFHAREPIATRVGLLNTGELVLVSPCGQAQVLTATTTRLIASVVPQAVTMPEARTCDAAAGALPTID